jgi:peroxiredoxin
VFRKEFIMAVTASTMLPLGTLSPVFSLPDTEGKVVSLGDFKNAPGLLVIFMCNHCPYVRHILKDLVVLVREAQGRGLAVVGISANDVARFPEDGPDKMALVARQNAFTFPYLYDETQKTAKAFHATCTPDFFLFDKRRRLVYRGQMDGSRPGTGEPVTGKDLRHAIAALLQGSEVVGEQRPSMGCSIKWKEGHEPEYAR